MDESRTTASEFESKETYTVTERHVVDLVEATCTCIEDYLYSGPCRHRRKVAKQVTKSASETPE